MEGRGGQPGRLSPGAALFALAPQRRLRHRHRHRRPHWPLHLHPPPQQEAHRQAPSGPSSPARISFLPRLGFIPPALLNAIGQSRVTLSLRALSLRALKSSLSGTAGGKRARNPRPKRILAGRGADAGLRHPDHLPAAHLQVGKRGRFRHQVQSRGGVRGGPHHSGARGRPLQD